MNYMHRMVTTSRPKINHAAWIEVRTLSLNDFAEAVKKHIILDDLIMNVDQTPSKFVPTNNVTMAEKGEKHASRKGASDKRGVTVTLSETRTEKFYLSK